MTIIWDSLADAPPKPICILPKDNPYKSILALIQRIAPSVSREDFCMHSPGKGGVFGVAVFSTGVFSADVAYSSKHCEDLYRRIRNQCFQGLFLIPITKIEDIDPRAADLLWKYVLVSGDI